MSKIFIINAHHYYPFAEGKLTTSLMEQMQTQLTALGHEIRTFHTDNEWDVEQEIENHLWADIVIVQTPVNWMGTPWTFKKYMDDVYTAGMMGKLCQGDGRTSAEPTKNYGAGGLLAGKKYMLSLTFNAPEAAFDDPQEYLFQGKSVDDLFFPMHMNFRFFAMEPIETFACYDVMKNPQVEHDFKRFEAHLAKHF